MGEMELLRAVVPFLLVVCAIFVARLRDLLAAVILLAALSLLLSLEFFLLSAPDVAIAEAGVGAAITTAIFVIAIRATKRT
ncbi:MAG: Na(+)/H(+) antiporter subunit B [Chloroflexota bacterium]